MGNFVLPAPEKAASVNSFDAASTMHIGQPLRRKEDQRLLTGRGQFSDDFSLPEQTHAAMVRSPHPHAKIKHIESAAAMSVPGVLAVITGTDLKKAGLNAIPHSPVPSTNYDLKLRGPDGGPAIIDDHFLLPTDRVRHVGEGVAMVVADCLEAALGGVEQVVPMMCCCVFTQSKTAV